MSLNIFWDNSNIWLVGQRVCEVCEPGYENNFRIDFAKLFDFVRDNRAVSFAYVGGSVPPNNDPLWQRFNNLGITVNTQERGAGGGEIAVDECIQLEMANRVLDVAVPETMILLTGDGSGYLDGKGFIKQLERAKNRGWNIEIISWDAGCNRHLKAFAHANGIYRPLEPAYLNVTFINNQRRAV